MSTISKCARLRSSIPYRSLKPCRRQFHATVPTRALDLDVPVQSYISRSRDPYLNLSIEHYLLTKSSPSSTILFIYRNRPCIVLGRNQNPWQEVNLPLLRATARGESTAPAGLEKIDLVRRRSGGGTVFHDEGNVNWSVICPPTDFSRDKHAEMVVRALRGLGVGRARVNERHDIVLDQGLDAQQREGMDGEDTHRTLYTADDPSGSPPLKVSGSAYKLTRTRSLHHATCLLSSPNLGLIPGYLHSPLKAHITARGVESVSSPVGNIGVGEEEFVDAVQSQFTTMYGETIPTADCGDELLEEPLVKKGYDELKSLDWIYGQTPQFTFSSQSRANGAASVPPEQFTLIVRNSAITRVEDGKEAGARDETMSDDVENMSRLLRDRKLHRIESWGPSLAVRSETAGLEEQAVMLAWLVDMLAVP